MSENKQHIDPKIADMTVTQNSDSSLDNNRREFIRVSTLLGTTAILGGVIEPSKSEARHITKKLNVQKIALEEHFNSPSCAEYLKSVDDLFDPEILANIS